MGRMIGPLVELLQERSEILCDRFGLRPADLIEEEVEIEWDRGRFLGGTLDDQPRRRYGWGRIGIGGMTRGEFLGQARLSGGLGARAWEG